MKDRLKIVSIVPESESPVSIFVRLKNIIEKDRPVAFVIDSYSALEDRMDPTELSKMIRYLQLLVKNHQVATLITMNVSKLNRLLSVKLSTLADNIIYLEYFMENDGISKKMLILKLRASNHLRKFHRYEITSKGMEIYD